MILHIPNEYDYHYSIPENLEKLIFYCFLCKQLNSFDQAYLYLAKTVLFYSNPRIRNF